LFALLPLALLLSGGGQTDPQSAGLQALDHQNYQEAEQVFSKLAAADSKNYFALFNLALAETGLNHLDSAVAHYKQVLALKPGLYEAEVNLGILDLRVHHPEDAVPLLREAVKEKPQQARAQRYLGDALLATGDLAGAADTYRAALAADPKMAPAELGLGQSLERQDKLEEALPHYQQAAALDSNLKSYELELAIAFSKANRADDAIALLQQFQNDPGAREELGRLYLQTNRAADAVAEFKAAVELSPTLANELALATAYLRNNQADLAAPILEQAVATNPNDYDLHMAIGRIHRDRRKKQEYAVAANQFVAAANLKPNSVEAWNEAVNAFVLAELYPQALAALDKIHRLNADTAGDYYYRAIVLDKLHQVKPALASYQQFLAMSQGKFPDQEFIARQRSRILEKEANR
jgi:tetratricopeptide (TPR) repeat protein